MVCLGSFSDEAEVIFAQSEDHTRLIPSQLTSANNMFSSAEDFGGRRPFKVALLCSGWHHCSDDNPHADEINVISQIFAGFDRISSPQGGL